MSQIKINDQDQKAFNKYKLISLNARNSLKNQKKTINMLNDFDGNLKELFEGEMGKKKLKINLIEYQLFKLKSDSVGTENKFDVLKRKYRCTEEELQLAKKNKHYLIKDNKNIKKNFLSTNIKLYRLYNKFKFKKLEDILEKYQKETYLNEFHKSQIRILNINISDKNSELRNLLSILENLIDLKNKQTHIDETYDLSEIYENKSKNIKKFNEKLIFIIKFVTFIHEKDKCLTELICSIRKGIKPSIKNNFISSILNRIQDFSFDDISFVRLTEKIYYLFFTYISNLALNMKFYYRRNELSNRGINSIQIIDTNKKFIEEKMQEHLEKAYFRLENKMKILSRTEKEIFKSYPSTIGDEKKKKDNLIPINKDLEILYQDYVQFNKKKGNVENNNFQSSLQVFKSNIIKYISKYRNNYSLSEKKSVNKSTINAKKTNIKIMIRNKSINKSLSNIISLKDSQILSDSNDEKLVLNTDFNNIKVNKTSDNCEKISRRKDILNLEKNLCKNEINNKNLKIGGELNPTFNKIIKKKINDNNQIPIKIIQPKFLNKILFNTSVVNTSKTLKNVKKVTILNNNIKNNYVKEIFDDGFIQNSKIEHEKLNISYFNKKKLSYSTDMTSTNLTHSLFGVKN